VVTSRRTGDDLIDDQDAPTSDIMAPPRQQPRKPATPASPDDAVSDGTAGGGVSPNGTPAPGKENTRAQDASANGVARDAARPAAADETVVDGVPALPADTIGVSRNAKPKLADPAPADPVPADPSPASGPSASSFGSPPAAAVPAVENPTIAYPAESGIRPPAVDPVPPGSPAPGSARPAGAVPPPGSRPAPADPPLSAAAFAWDMPDPPPSSPSSPARTFLRSGTTPRDQAAPKAGPAAPTTAAAGQGTAAKAPGPSAGPATAGSQAPQGPGLMSPGLKGTGLRGPGLSGPGLRGTAQKGPAQKGQKTRQKRTTARQAHLTVARVEPWSVMKFSFVVSLVAFVVLFVAVSVLYGALAGLGVFDSLQRVVSSVTSSQGSAGVNAKAWFSASRVLGYTALLGSLNIVLITAMSTIGAVVYNLTSRLVGGVEVTLRETE
jgi:Transmembrane domain of unknown function (DUF3566)